MDRVAAIEILTGPIALMLVGYVVLVVALAYAVNPLRLRIADTIGDMLDEKRWNGAQRDELMLIAKRATSFVVGLLVPVAILSVIIDDILRRPERREPWMNELAADDRFVGLAGRFFVSVLAANPLAAIVTIPLMIVSAFIQLVFRGASPRTAVNEAVEEPALRALGSFIRPATAC